MRYYLRNPDTSNHDEIVATLKRLLADTYLLYIQTQGAHWNVVGSDFPQLHTLFQTQYTELTAAVDLLAEHIRTYGAVAPASAAEFVELASFEELRFDTSSWSGSGRALDGNSLISALINQHQATIAVATHLGEITSGAIHTQNLAADRIEAHEKAVWMLTATLNRTAKRYY